MRKTACFLTLLVALTLFTAPAQAAETIKIGVAGAHSGDLASYGLPTLEAARLVAAAQNAKGGLLGKQIEIVSQDDQCKAELASNVATNLLAAGVVGIIGHTCSGPTKAALPIYKDANMILISPSATSPQLTHSGFPNFFRTISSDDQQAKVAVDYLLGKLNVTKVALIHDKGDYGKGFVEYSKRFLEESGKAKVVLFEGITVGAPDYSAVVEKIRRSDADAIMYGGYHPEASKLIRQIRKRRIEAPFVSDDGIRLDTFIQVAKADAEGVYATSPTDVSQLPAYQAAVAAFKAKFNSDNTGEYFKEATAAAQALIAAIEAAGTTSPDKVMEALRRNYVETALGKLRFDANGDAEGVGYSIYQVQNGAFVELK